MNKLYLITLSIFLFFLFGCKKSSEDSTVAPEKHPNILLILMDDLGWTAIEAYGNKYVKTPYINSLAEDGMKFTQAYVTPQCTPTRASLLTGQHTARNKMWHVIPKYEFPNAYLKEPEYLQNLPDDVPTMAEALQEAGYTTACLGKWHLHVYGGTGYYTRLFPDSASYYGFDYVDPMTDPSEYQAYTDKGVDFLSDEAIGFISRNKDRPFFIYLSHHTIHRPVLAPDSLVQYYKNQGYPDEGQQNATYLAAIKHFDNGIGRVLQHLDDEGLTDNTVVIFLSDNGGVDTEFDNTPLRYGKGSAYEGGIRVPFLIRWPGKIKPGTVSEQQVHVTDFYPTLVEIAGGTIPEGHVVDGINLLPVLTNEKNQIERGYMYWYMPLYDPQWGAVPAAVVRKGDFKLIEFFGDYIDLDQDSKYITEGRVELYNLKEDIGETIDLSGELLDLTAEMQAELHRWINEMGEGIPEKNPNYDPERALKRPRRRQ
jgi:arylsulfatase A